MVNANTEAPSSLLTTFRVASIQMVSREDTEKNVSQALALLERGVDQGAQLLVLPENWAVFDVKGYRAFSRSSAMSARILSLLGDFCCRNGVWVCAGTIPVPPQRACAEGVSDKGLKKPHERSFARCCLINDKGSVVGAYDKLHLFDVKVADAHGRYRESAVFLPGEHGQVVSTPFGNLGLAVCYDLRFPELFRWMALRGAEMFLVPSAFTQVTGEAHWSVLTRARALENLAYVVAANQGGVHSETRETWGHSCVVDPWGTVLSERQEKGEGVVLAEIDRSRITQLRQQMPVLEHVRLDIHPPNSTELP